jgi:uncharacterized protein (TIGR03067 family)
MALLLAGGPAWGDGADDKWEFKAVNLGKEEKGATKKLNELMQDGWEIAGVLGNNLTAFRRPIAPAKADKVAAVDAPKPETKPDAKPEAKKDEGKKEVKKPEPKKEEPKEEPKKEIKKEEPKKTETASAKDEAPELPKAPSVLDKIAADIASNTKPAPSPSVLDKAVDSPAMAPAMAPAMTPAEPIKTPDQVASVTPKDSPKEERSILKTKPEILPPAKERGLDAEDQEALQGTWSLVLYVLNGRQVRGQDSGSTWVIEEDRWTSRWLADNGTLQVASGFFRAVPGPDGAKRVDLVHTDGLYKGRTTFAVFQLENGTLKYCYTGNPALRPAGFATSEGDGLGMVVWQKVAK